MPARQLDTVLADVPLFEGFDAGRVALLTACAGNVHFARGAYVFRQGDPANVFYVVRHGSVALETFVPTRGSVLIETIESPDVVGWSWLFPPFHWHFDARAVTPVRATQFDGTCLRQKCDEDPALGYELMSRFAQVVIERLQWTRLRLLDVYGNGDAR